MAVGLGVQHSLDVQGLDQLIKLLALDGFTVVGPRVSEQVITYGEISGTDDLPAGWTDNQQPGRYRLDKRDDEALFGYAVGPHSWKKYLFPSKLTLWSASRSEDGSLNVSQPDAEPPTYAFLGVRGCEMAAIQVQDRVFASERYGDADYRARRESAFIIAVNCGTAAETCFCPSMSTGPRVKSGFDISLTELLDEDSPRYVVEIGSERGQSLIDRLGLGQASVEEIQASEDVTRQTEESITRKIDTDGIKEILYSSRESSRWDEIASRCLSCANCTMVCPTCFCHSVSETSDLQMTEFEHTREWDSCFSMDFTYAAGGVARDTTSSRYRQWMTHKLGSWIDQFGTSGCVGCGRCIAWCPVGIDITEEAGAFRLDSAAAAKGGSS